MTLPVPQGVGAGSETSAAWPTHAAGDWGYLFVEHGGGTVATPTGCAIVEGFPIVHPSGVSTLSAFRKLAASSSEAALALSGGTDHMWGRILTIRGAHATKPTMAIATAYQQTAAATAGWLPGLVTPLEDALIVAVIGWTIDNAGGIASSFTNALLASITEQGDDGTLTGNGGGLMIVSAQLATPGPTGISTVTLTSTQWEGALLAFRPGSAAFTVAGTITIAGSPAPNGMSVEIYDKTQGVLETTTTVAGGAGAFSAGVPSGTSDYRAVADNGASYGAAPLDQAV